MRTNQSLCRRLGRLARVVEAVTAEVVPNLEIGANKFAAEHLAEQCNNFVWACHYARRVLKVKGVESHENL